MTLAVQEGVRHGPTGNPEHTLGWQILGWATEYLLQPDGPKAGEPWNFTDEQARFLLNWYAVDAEGRFTYRYGMFRRMKGHGKDPLGAALCCIEMVGPCRFSHWKNGQPVAEPHYAAWVQTAAVSREQTRNTMTLFPGMISPKAINEYEIDLGKEIIYAFKGRKRIEAVTSSPRALEGGRATFVLKNETHHWLRPNEGHEMAKVIARNVAKSRDGSARVLAISNAHAPGEDSDAEHDYEAYQKIAQGLSDATGILYDSLEAPADVDLDDDAAVKAAVEIARGDSLWVDSTRLLNEIRDPRTSAAMARRFYFNTITALEDKPFDIQKFEALGVPGYKVARGELITLGFDGSRNRDHTALIGTEVKTGHQWVVGYWEPILERDGKLWIDDADVDETVRSAFRDYKVHRMYCDPSYWFEYLSLWSGAFGDAVVKYPTNSHRRIATDCANYRDAIEAGSFSHDGDPRFVAAIRNSYKHMHEFTDDNGERMWSIQKERNDSPLKIDAAYAAIISRVAREDAVREGLAKPGGETLSINTETENKNRPEFAGIRGRDW